MPWYNGDYPPSYKNQPIEVRDKATEIANELLLNGMPEGVAIATGLKKAREVLQKKKARPQKKAPMPGDIAPMLCTLTKEPIDDREYLYEIKWDGYRIISHVKKRKGPNGLPERKGLHGPLSGGRTGP